MADISITTSEPITALPPGEPHREAIVERIITLAMSGLSRSQIAKEVGWTRSAIIGVLWRRKIPCPVTIKPKPAAKPRTANASRTKRRKIKPPTPVADVMAKGATSPGVQWSDLDTSRMCCWPTSEGMCCGDAKTDGSYCRHHHRLSRKAA